MLNHMYKRTKIVATIGPASSSPVMLEKLIKAGMNVARLNFSHGAYEEKEKIIKDIRNISKKLGKPTAIISDLQGPKMRLGLLDGVLELKKGQEVLFSGKEKPGVLPMQFDLVPHVKKGDRFSINDGLVGFEVLDVDGDIMKTIVLNNGWISSKKGINAPDINIGNASFTAKDREDAIFSIKNGVEYIAMSFVQSASDLDELKSLIKKHKSQAKIISKVEKKEAVKNLEQIIIASDAVMVARGDLGTETDASKVPIIQYRMVKLARFHKKPVIVATQMLESMIENPRPTRAETSDVANAVFDQVDAVMLSAESASGKYPVEAVSTMNEIITSVEMADEFNSHRIKVDWGIIPPEDILVNSIGSAAVALAFRIKSSILAVASATGRTARIVSSFRPTSQIIAVTHDQITCNQMNLVWGVTPIVVMPAKKSDPFWDKISQVLVKYKLANKDEMAVMVAGSVTGVPGATDTVKVVKL